jgi:hypothetical protein
MRRREMDLSTRKFAALDNKQHEVEHAHNFVCVTVNFTKRACIEIYKHPSTKCL